MFAPFSLSRASFAPALLLAAAALAGCGGDCSTEPSSCPTVPTDTLCAGGACTVDGAAVACSNGYCGMDLTQKLSIPLAGSRVGADTPDLLIDASSSGAIAPADVVVAIDGQILPVTADPDALARFRTQWSPAAEPALLEISFAKGSGAIEVRARFANVACVQAETAACNGGGE